MPIKEAREEEAEKDHHPAGESNLQPSDYESLAPLLSYNYCPYSGAKRKVLMRKVQLSESSQSPLNFGPILT